MPRFLAGIAVFVLGYEMGDCGILTKWLSLSLHQREQIVREYLVLYFCRQLFLELSLQCLSYYELDLLTLSM